jgi:hypothetical protein
VLRARLSLLELCFFDVFQAFLRVDVRWKRYDIWRDQEDGWAYLVSISSADTGTANVHLVRRLEQANLRAQEPILGGQFGTEVGTGRPGIWKRSQTPLCEICKFLFHVP